MQVTEEFFYSETGQLYQWDNDYLQVQKDSPKGKVTPLPLVAPSGEEAIFKVFVGLTGEKEDFLRFAHKYGPLNTVLHPDSPPDKKYHQSYVYWRRMHRQMKKIHDLYQAIDDISQKKGCINLLSVEEICGDKIIPIDLNSGTELIDAVRRVKAKASVIMVNHEQPLSWIDLQKTNDFLSLKSLVQMYISKAIHDATRIYSYQYRQKYDAVSERWGPVITPNSLSAFLWYQLSEEVSGYRIYKRCRYCDLWEDLTGPHRRVKQWTAHPNCGSNARVKKSYEEKAKTSPPKKRGRPRKEEKNNV